MADDSKAPKKLMKQFTKTMDAHIAKELASSNHPAAIDLLASPPNHILGLQFTLAMRNIGLKALKNVTHPVRAYELIRYCALMYYLSQTEPVPIVPDIEKQLYADLARQLKAIKHEHPASPRNISTLRNDYYLFQRYSALEKVFRDFSDNSLSNLLGTLINKMFSDAYTFALSPIVDSFAAAGAMARTNNPQLIARLIAVCDGQEAKVSAAAAGPDLPEDSIEYSYLTNIFKIIKTSRGILEQKQRGETPETDDTIRILFRQIKSAEGN